MRPLPRARAALAALGPFAGLALVVALFLAIPPHHAVSLRDLQTVAVHTMIVAIGALGMTCVILMGGIDLSVGSAIALSSVAAALALERGSPAIAVAVVAVATGAMCGLYNGLLIVGARLPPFIATLGTLGFFRGLAKWLSGSAPVSPSLEPVRGLVDAVQPVPPPHFHWMRFAPAAWLTLLLAAAIAAFLRWSILGRRALAVGGNERAAAICGVPVARVRLSVYTLAGALAGLGGLLMFARLGQGDPTVAVGLELEIIAAVVIGGASLSGGHGSVLGTLVGACMMAYLRNRCVRFGWPNFVQEMIVGHIIIAAVAADRLRSRA